jgi:DNA-binding transcriptional LysR family regulator
MGICGMLWPMEVDTMNNLQIDYFLAVAKSLSFTKAASENYVSQPAISKQIIAMEEELGVQLFVRSRKSMRLTEAGKLYVDFYRRQRAEFDLLSHQVREMRDEIYIPLKIAFGNGWTLSHFMPGIIKKIQECIPMARITLICDELINLETMLQKEQADVILSVNINIHSATNIEIKHIAKIPSILIYPKNNSATARAKSPSDFKDELFFVPIKRELDSIINLVNSFVEPYDFAPKIQRVDNVDSMMANIHSGLGVAIVDSWIIDNNRHSLLTMPLDTEYSIVAAWKNKNKNPALTVFLEELFKLPPESF